MTDFVGGRPGVGGSRSCRGSRPAGWPDLIRSRYLPSEGMVWMQWVCLGFPPLLLVFMLALGRIEQALTAAEPPRDRSQRVILRPTPMRDLVLHHSHRIRPMDLGRSVRRMRSVAFRPQTRPNRYGPYGRSVGARRR
ncbi:MAG TPA: hypothetical protein VHC49_14020 [Mycobacteriales bacterium]|nr:hypothetical protein [Mycobacteriales bacterium]